MWNRDEYFKGVSFWKIAFIVGFIIGIIAFASGVRASDNKTLEFDVGKLGWPTQTLYDTVGACYQGTFRWIVIQNPSLIGQMPPPYIQRQMVEHCFCVIDRIRKIHGFLEYVKLATLIGQVEVGQLFLDNALHCVKENGTLAGIMVIEDGSSDDAKTDNETITTKEEGEPEQKDTSKEESLPDQKKEEESTGQPDTIFQG